jgi:hypothetical protein
MGPCRCLSAIAVAIVWALFILWVIGSFVD